MMKIARVARRWLWRAGVDVGWFTPPNHPMARRKKFLKDWSIDLVLDVGANVGQYAIELRRDLGYKGRIVSFEPLYGSWKRLQGVAEKDAHWDVVQCGLGDRTEIAEMNVSENFLSSSLLLMADRHMEAAPASSYTGTESVRIFRLDDIFEKHADTAKNIWLKLDVQGSEKNVVAGAEEILDKISAIQVELSLQPMYHGEALIEDICSDLRKKGFVLVSLEPGFADHGTGELLQVDGVFRRR